MSADDRPAQQVPEMFGEIVSNPRQSVSAETGCNKGGESITLGAGVAEITPEMIEAGVQALRRHIPLDIAQPLSAEEDIVVAIYQAMAAPA